MWLTSEAGRIAIGAGSMLNLNAMVTVLDRVQIGEQCMLANGCLVTDTNHRFDDPDQPVPTPTLAAHDTLTCRSAGS